MALFENLILTLIKILSVIFAGGLVLYFDGIIFSGGKEWRKGIQNAFLTIRKGYLYFLANIVAMVIVGYFLERLIAWILFTYRKYFLPTLILFMVLLYFYYLQKYTKKGLRRWNVLFWSIFVLLVYFLFWKYF